jgi:hypothetical protein
MRDVSIGAVQARVRRAWYDDGLFDLLTGAFFVALGAWALAPRSLQRWLGPLWFVAFVVVFYRGRGLLLRLKERFTFPRGGYALPVLPPWPRRLLTAVVILLPMLAGPRLEDVLRTAGWPEPWFTSFSATWALSCAIAALWYGLPSFARVGALAVLLSFGLPLSGLTGRTLGAVFMFALGGAFLLTGALALHVFWRRTGSVPDSVADTDGEPRIG